ncbi:MAG: hypothetical protein H0W10_07525 [Chloroflexi bacterium]|nr:hypothetical protein [Chloroflexota bacterium]
MVVIGPSSVYGDDRAWLVRPDGYIADSLPLHALGGLEQALQRASGRALG